MKQFHDDVQETQVNTNQLPRPRMPLPQPPGFSFQLSRALARDSLLNPEERAALELSRALARDGQLNPEERIQRDNVALNLAQKRNPPRPVPPPGKQVAAYKKRLEQAGWQTKLFTHPLRGRLEGFHPSGAAVMLTADRRRTSAPRKVIPYLLPPGKTRWYKTDLASLEDFIVCLKLPPRAKNILVGTKCHCPKIRYPTLAAAAAAINVATSTQITQRAARRCYRCEADDRVWHLTSKLSGYVHPVPLADAYLHRRDVGQPQQRIERAGMPKVDMPKTAPKHPSRIEMLHADAEGDAEPGLFGSAEA